MSMTKKRRREIASVDTKLVEIYEDLSNEALDIRQKAALALISRFTEDQNPTTGEAEKAITRLFRGLCSGRKAARLGFSVALTELLSTLLRQDEPTGIDINVEHILNIWKNVTARPPGSASGQEGKDHYFGKVFGAKAIIKSKILFQPGVPSEYWTETLSEIIALSKKAPWLREECGWSIYTALDEKSSETDFAIGDAYAQQALQLFCSNQLSKTPEGVALWLCVQARHKPDILVKGIWLDESPLHKEEKSVLSKALRETPIDGLSQKGSWNSKLHFVWDLVLARLYKLQGGKPKEEPTQSINFAEFWSEVIDRGLFSTSASHERKHWGFMLFIKVIKDQNTPLGFISDIFSPNLVNCMLNHASSSERYLHAMAIKSLKALESRAQQQPESILSIISGLIGSREPMDRLDQTTRKTLENVMGYADAVTLDDAVSFLETQIVHPRTDNERATNTNRQIFADVLVSVVRQHKNSLLDLPETTSDGWVERLWKVLVTHGYFQDTRDPASGKEVPAPTFSEASRTLFRTRLTSCLTQLMSSTRDPSKYPYNVVRYISRLEKRKHGLESILEMDESGGKYIVEAQKTLSRIKKAKKGYKDIDESVRQALMALLSLAILQVYNGEPDSLSLLEELQDVLNKLGKKEKQASSREQASEMLVEILLGFVSKPSQLFRQLSTRVFTVFSHHITAEGLQSLFRVLEAKENLAGQEEMFDEEDDHDSDDDGSEDSLPSDVEMIDAEANSGSSSERGDESDGEGNEELEAFGAKLAAASSAGSSDEEMDDEQVKALDAPLIRIFQERQKLANKTKDKKNAKEKIINFKSRVLDLLDVYIKQQHSNPLALHLIMPLLEAMRTTTSKQISEKVSNIAREYCRLCKGNSLPTLPDQTEAWEVLQQIHCEAKLGSSNAHGNTCSQLSLLIVKVILGSDFGNTRKGKTLGSFSRIVALYAELWKAQFLEDCKVPPAFFVDFKNWTASIKQRRQ
ncbi:MAG: DNA-directed DNA polymerase [Cirrosporium novae-zelandiae]|nr:MAG: DNA-directed DNA polymerase [Cirrosporium novae-zelandiae]